MSDAAAKSPWRIPATWSWATIGEVATVVGGGTPSTTEPAYWEGGDIPWLTPADLSGYTSMRISSGARPITPAGLRESSARLLPAGTVLMSSRAPVGYVAIASRAVATNQGFKSFLPTPALLPEYLYYFILGNRPLLLARASGTTFQEISGKAAATIPVAIPPIDEQHRIVAAIDEHLSRLDAAVIGFRRALAMTPRYRSAVLEAACEGSLVRGDSATWTSTKLGDVVTALRNGISTKPTETSGQAILRISAVRAMSLDANDVRYLRPDPAWDPFVLDEGDLLFTRYNGNPNLVGACALVPQGLPRVVHPDKLIRVKADRTKCTPAFLQIAMNAGQGRAHVRSRTKTSAGQAGISGADLKAAPLDLPTLVIQQQIANEVECRLSVISVVERQLEAALTRAARLRQSILKRAFEGVLVPQNRHDEPAGVLLARLRATRPTPAPKPRRSRRPA